jgi:NCS2 family nucleobase:cation symporter-2
MLISYQKANDAGWKRPDTRSMSGGLVAGGLSNVVSGAIGGVGLGVSAGSVGLAIATGAMARSIGLVTAAIFVVLAFLPQVTAMLALIPSPVLGAGLIYVACHLIASGTELIASRMLDARRIYVVGLPLVAGVGLIAVPGLLDAAPSWAGAVLASPLAAATILALGLNLALNVGVSSWAVVSVGIDEGLKDAVARFFDQQGASWGARIDVISRAAPAVTEWCEELRAATGAGAATIDLLYDEFKLLATVRPAPTGDPGEEGSRKASTELFELAARTIARRYGCTAKLLPEQGTVFAFEH